MTQPRFGTFGALCAFTALVTSTAATLHAQPVAPAAPAATATATSSAPVAPPSAPTAAAPPTSASSVAPVEAPPAQPAAGATDGAPAGAGAPPASPALPTTAPNDEAAADVPTQLGAGKQGFVKFGALLQFWGLMSMLDDDTTTTFRLRRAELKAYGEIVPKLIAYKLVIDPAKVLETKSTTVPVVYEDETAGEPASVTVPTPGDKLSILQDFAITFLSEYADVSVGQFKNGLSYEGMTSSAKLMFPERAPVVRAYGDKRDIGISAEKTFEYVHYSVGLFNGPGLNLRDDNNQKDLSMRLELLPTKGLLFGVVGYTSLGERDQPTTKDRVEVDARLDLSNFLVQAEYIRGWDGPSDAAVVGHGYYGALGYTFFDQLQPVVRVGQLDLNLDASGAGPADELTHIDFGLNYYILGPEARVGASVSMFDFADAGTQTDVTLMAQASF